MLELWSNVISVKDFLSHSANFLILLDANNRFKHYSTLALPLIGIYTASWTLISLGKTGGNLVTLLNLLLYATTGTTTGSAIRN